MKNSITAQLRKTRKISYLAVAFVVFAAGLPLLHPGQAHAGQIQYRSIQMSDSSPSNGTFTSGVGSGVGVTYKVSFKAVTNASSMVIDFCQEDPIIGDTCSAPTGMSVTSAAIDPTNTGDITSSGWALTTSNAPNPRLKLAQGSGNQITAGTQENFKITGITNPSGINAATKGSFFARIYTYYSNDWKDSAGVKTYTNATSAANDGHLDYGGIALSVDSVINITARVQETLTFCVSGNDPNNWTTTGDCGDSAVTAPINGLTNTNLILGHGSPTAVLEPGIIDYANIWTQLSTNATNGAVINMHTNIPCGGLSADYQPGPPATGTCSIPAINGGAATGPTQMASGTAAFGVAINKFTPTTQAGPAAVGTLTPTTPYYDAAHYAFTGNVPDTTNTYFGMDNTTATGFDAGRTTVGPPFSGQSSYNGAVTGLFGSTVLYATGPISRVDARYTFAATPSITTPAGIYTANLSLIATGTF